MIFKINYLIIDIYCILLSIEIIEPHFRIPTFDRVRVGQKNVSSCRVCGILAQLSTTITVIIGTLISDNAVMINNVFLMVKIIAAD